MTAKLTVGVSKKVGLPDYGSYGASCGVEIDVDASLLEGDVVALQRQVRSVFEKCEHAIEEELARRRSTAQPPPQTNRQPVAAGVVDRPELRVSGADV